MQPEPRPNTNAWPSLPLEAWQDTYSTLHMWMQIVGKVRLAQAPLLNHWWQVPFYLTVRGLTTSPIPYDSSTFQVDFDFIDHQLRIQTSDGAARAMELAPRSVAEFHREFMAALRELGMEIRIWTMPVELESPTRFEEDEQHATYDADAAHCFWRILMQTDRVLQAFRTRFLGKSSPVHFFWGSFDLAVTRFSGRRAPEHPGGVPGLADYVAREAYSHEVSSLGFWPGGGAIPEPAFYSYAYPEPAGFADFPILPSGAFYSNDLKEFVLPYDVVRTSDDPDATLLTFAQSSYEAAAKLGQWDRAALERLPIS